MRPEQAGAGPAFHGSFMRALSIALVVALTLSASGAAAKPKPGQSASASASAAPSPSAPSNALDVPDAELPPLPQLAPLKKEEADAESIKAVEALLARLTSEKKDIRDAAFDELGKLGKRDKTGEATELAWVPAVRARIQDIRESLDRDRAPALLEDARKAARKGLSKKDLEDDDKTDWLDFVLRKPMPRDEAWRDLVELLASVRMLTAIGTTPAVRELIELRSNFGEFLRRDVSRALLRLGDRAVPGLLEATKHDAVVVQQFANQTLDKLGKVTPGEIVSMSDLDALSDTLRAFGRIRNEEAVDVLLSFANHDRKKVRDAAREAVAAIGEPGRWRLRDAYQDLTGEKVEKSVPWDTLAKRIFAIYDKARVKELWGTFSSGLDAANAGKHDVAIEAYDKVLAQSPLFDRRKDMATSYFEVAKTIGFDKAEDRLAMLRKARRLDPQSESVTRIDAEIAFTEAKVLIAEGRPDRFLLKRATDLDPTHEEAKALLASFEKAAVPPPAEPPMRYGPAGAIAGGALVLAALAAFFLRKKTPPPASPPKPA